MPARTEAFPEGFRFAFEEDPMTALHALSGFAGERSENFQTLIACQGDLFPADQVTQFAIV
jgi:hypothetical protein